MSKSKKIKHSGISRRITRLEYCAYHFRDHQFETDMFYVDLSNNLYRKVLSFFSTRPGFSDAMCRRIAITLACYVEDLVAGSEIWAAFVSLYRKKYGKSNPFFNIQKDEDPFFSFDDEVPSLYAVQFILWYLINEMRPSTVINPNNPGLSMLSTTILPDLINAYEDAPDTPSRPMLTPEEKSGIPLFYQIRNLCEWLCRGCYLTRIVNREKVTEDLESFIEGIALSVDDFDPGARAYAIDSFVTMNALIGPLAIPSYEWLAEIIRLYHEPEEETYIPILTSMKALPYNYYKYISTGESELVLENARGEKLTLSASTMPDEKFMPDIAVGKSALLALVFFDGVWLMNGIGLQALPSEVFEKYRQGFIEKEEQHKAAFDYLHKAFGNERIGVSGSYEEFIKLAYGNDTPPEKGNYKLIDDIRREGNLLYFLNSDSSISILPGWAEEVKIKGNPYYDKEAAKLDGVSLIFDHAMSTPEMRDYIIKHNLIPDAALNSIVSPEAGRELFQNDIRFFNDYSDRDTITSVADF